MFPEMGETWEISARSHGGYVGISVAAPGDGIHFIGQENRIIIIIILHLNGVSRNVMLWLIVVDVVYT